MFTSLTERLSKTFSKITGKGKLTEGNIQDTLGEVREALLEADVALSVVRQFISQVRLRALGIEVTASLSPGQALVKIVNDELVAMMGAQNDCLDLRTQPPSVVLMSGLQGAGKTTSTAKLGLWLKHREKKKVMVVSTDIYRPAAIDQLRTLADEAQIDFIESNPSQKPADIARAARTTASKQFADVLIVDTPGRLHIDAAMMAEIKQLHTLLNPVETLFVVDAMTGQDAANSAKSFSDVLPLTGVILTKTDGDARGGAALSVRAITGKPIKFMAVGEKIDALEAFHPERIASRILGMGDVLSLIEDAEQKIDKQKALKLSKKIKRGKKFDLNDFRDQIQQVNNMGGIASMLHKLPGMGSMSKMAEQKLARHSFAQMGVIISSMTPKERQYPTSINGSRKKRIAWGSGTQVQDVNRLLKQHKQMQKTMTKLSKKGAMANMMRDMGSMMDNPGGRMRGR